jgi:signal transduction histidine kinase
MHALLENAITYSYDNSKVVVSGAVRRGVPGGSPSASVSASASTTSTLSTSSLDLSLPVSTPESTPAAGYTEHEYDDGVTPPSGVPLFDIAASSSTIPFGAESDATGTEAGAATGKADWKTEDRDTVRLSVQDSGIGIPARDLDRIFERFYRVDHGRSRDTGGTGLGLSIVRHVANNHQGWVDVESREGEGSTFSLVLPLQGERERAV